MSTELSTITESLTESVMHIEIWAHNRSGASHITTLHEPEEAFDFLEAAFENKTFYEEEIELIFSINKSAVVSLEELRLVVEEIRANKATEGSES